MLRWLLPWLAILEIAQATTFPGHAAATPRAEQGRRASAIAAPTAEVVPAGQIRFRSFGAADGLRNLVVWSLAQDGAGMVWVGTDDGVYRYDGKRFAHFSVQDGLPSSAVSVLGVAPDGQICAGGAKGMVCWDTATHRFDAATAAGLPNTVIRGIAQRADQLWVGTDEGLFVREGDAAFVRAPGWPGGRDAVPALWADALGVVAALGPRIVIGDGKGAWTVGGAALGSAVIDGVARDQADLVWIRSAVKIWAWSPVDSTLRDLSEGVPPSHEAAAHAAPLTVSPAGEVWVGTDQGIVYRRDDRWHVVGQDAGLPGALARSILIDREGTTWIGAVGLFQWAGRSLVTRHDVASGFVGDLAWTIGRDQSGLWAGTNRCLARVVGGAWRCQPGTTGRSTRAAVTLPDGGTFIGGAPGDLLYIAPGGATVSILPQPFQAEQHILSLAVEPGGDLWMGSRYGLFRLAGARPGPLGRVAIPGVDPRSRISQLLYVDSRLWATTEQGLAVRDDGDDWRVFATRDGLRDTATRSVVRRADGRMCVSYAEAIGLSCFDFDGEHLTGFEHFGEPEGLASGVVYFFGEDREARLWVGTGNGVDVLTSRGIDHFGEEDGLVGDDSAAAAFFADTDGSIWLGATGGVSHVMAQHYLGTPLPPHVLILDGRLGGRRIQLDAATPIQAPHDASSLLVEFAAGSFLDPHRLEPQTRLWPVESAWSANLPREVRTPALPPGAYRLDVRARLGGGAWGPTAHLHFDVLAAWWQTRWIVAVLLCAALCALGAVFAWRYRALVRRRTRQLIARADASFRAHIDSIPDIVAVYRDLTLVQLNAAARAFFGAGIDPRERIHDDDRTVLDRLIAETVPAEPSQRAEVFELRLGVADGTWRVCEVSSLRLSYGGGPVMVVSARDITERQRLRAQLLISDRMASLGTLAAGIAHEINNPLAYVSGNLEVLTGLLGGAEAMSDDDRREAGAALDDAREGATRVRKIVQDLRSFNRCQEERRTSLELATVIHSATKLTRNEIRHRAELSVELAATPRVIADDGRLTQVLINLLVNAAQAVPPGNSEHHRVVVRTYTSEAGHAVLEVEDSGPGMAPQVRARAFDPFFTTKKVGQGTGLGLAICHNIVVAIGGQISIETGALGGCLMRVTLPPDQSAAREPPKTEAAPAPALCPRRRVLLIDDDPLVTKALERMLRTSHDVTVANSGDLAVRWIDDGARFDAIVTDVMMPTMTGLDVLDRVAARSPDQAHRFVFLSGGVFSEDLRKRLDATGAPQLEKPVDAATLRAEIARFTAAS